MVNHSLRAVAARLRLAGCVYAEDEAELLITHASNEYELSEMIAKREEGIPLEQILGWAEFCGLKVRIAPGVFIPRQRTEFLVSQALALAHPNDVVLDLCCGSGAIGLVILSELRTIKLLASDIDASAIRCAKENLDLPGAQVFEADLFDGIPDIWVGKINILVANAPYVPSNAIEMMPRESRLHENRISLDGGTDGLTIQRRIAELAQLWLAPNGYLLVETSERQSTLTSKIFESNGLKTDIIFSEEHESSVVIGKKTL
jgi:release factor glutamine methyltransferase